jgi:hypothetical protein
MFFAPHTLQIKRTSEPRYDEYGRIVRNNNVEWETICVCRCSDNTTREFRTPNGQTYRPSYHVVCNGNISAVKDGDYARCMQGDEVRAEGVIRPIRRIEHKLLNYSELWLNDSSDRYSE